MSKHCELSDRELTLWIIEHVMEWTEGREYHIYESADRFVELNGEILAFNDPPPSDGEADLRSSRTWDPVYDSNNCAQAMSKIEWKGLAEDFTHWIGLVIMGYRFYDDPNPEEFAAAVFATPRQKCETMWIMRDEIKKIRRSE